MSTKKKSTTYYVIAGPNAYGVYTNPLKAEKAASYISSYEWKKFEDFESAKVWATNRLFSLHVQQYDAFPDIDIITRLNWCYHRKKRKKYIFDD